MQSLKFIFLIAFIVLCNTTAIAQSNYDHHWLVQTWPNGYCSGNSCGKNPLPQMLVLHGFWPADSVGVTPTKCKNIITDPTNVIIGFPLPLKNDMNTFWPSIGTFASNMAFWVHEWQQHGSCQAEPPLPYFSTTIQLTKSIGLDTTLKAAIRMGGLAPKADVIQAINAKLRNNVAPIFRCVKKNGNELLSEIILCVDKQGKNVIACGVGKEKNRDNCGAIIKLPAQVE